MRISKQDHLTNDVHIKMAEYEGVTLKESS